MLAAPGSGAAGAGPPTLEDCDARVREAPDEAGSYYCYIPAVRAHGRVDEAVQRLEAILAARPELHRIRMNLAMVEAVRNSPRTDDLLREAIDGMETVGDHHGVVYGAVSLADRLGERGRLDEADALLARAVPAAEATGDPVMSASVQVGQAAQANRRGYQGRALALYRQAEMAAFPGGPFFLQCSVLSGQGALHWYFEDFREALAVYRREAEIREKAGDRIGLASTYYNIALLTSALVARGEIERAEYLALLPEVLEVAVRSGDLDVEARVRILIGDDSTSKDTQEQFARALTLAQKTGNLGLIWLARRCLADARAKAAPENLEGALRQLDEVIEETRRHGSYFHVARGLIGRAYLAAHFLTREEAVEAHLAALDAVERIRGLQAEETVRARVFSHWGYAYYRLAGLLLQGLDRSAAPDRDLDLALRTMERFRARVLLDTILAAGAQEDAEDDPLHTRRRAVLERISGVQRDLSDPAMDEGKRLVWLTLLERLEVEEAGLRDRIAHADPSFAAHSAPAVPSLDEIREALADDQALLSFQLWGRQDPQGQELDIGASWLMVVAREDSRAFPLPDRQDLAVRVGVLEGLLANRDGSEARAAARLYRDLLAAALAALPGGVRRLVIVPDGPLHRCPFGVLRAGDGDAPLARCYEISLVPSATLWHHWKQEEASPLPRPRVLSLAAPDLGATEDADLWRAADPWIRGLRTGALDRAEQEARTLARAVGGESQVLTGAAASEHRLKETDLSGYGILHFATHAVVDERQPGRSAVLLAPGAAHEDGFLQIREIVDLDLDGQVVILTACRSASGEVIGGEGVQGLAQAFFQAGARSVVASLWPLRDDETERLMKDFSRHLGRGHSLAGALAAARVSRIDAGAPAAAWAGLLVLGDGDHVPVPGGRGPGAVTIGLVLLGAVLGVLILSIFLRRRRRGAVSIPSRSL
jgi:CHAT domain-containing protein/tetratricopeptide (TPR) repeat protein